MKVTLTGVDALTPQIRQLTFADPAGRALPSFAPGSHLVVDAGQVRNAYSLTGEPVLPLTYSISVLRRPGAGGSDWLHRLDVGAELEVEPPRSAFAPVAAARRHLYIAGGIGVTPILSHVRAAVRWDRDFRVLYTYRDGQGAHLGELRRLAGDRLSAHTGRAELVAAAEVELRRSPLGTHAYVCGPAGLLRTVSDLAVAAGWPAGRIHTERFAAEPADAGRPFTIRLRHSGAALTVASGQSILQRLLAEGVEVAHLCRQGVCGECRLPLAAGRAEHRDHYLSGAEREFSVMACVSRALDDELELDL